MPDQIQFNNIDHEGTLIDLYPDEVGHEDNDSCSSDNDWKETKKESWDRFEELVADLGIDNDEVDDLDNEDAIHLNDGFGDIKDIVNDGVQHGEDNQQHHFGGPIENEGEQYDHFGGPDQENEIPDHDINIDDDVVEDDNHNRMNIIPDDSSRTNSDTAESFDTN